MLWLDDDFSTLIVDVLEEPLDEVDEDDELFFDFLLLADILLNSFLVEELSVWANALANWEVEPSVSEVEALDDELASSSLSKLPGVEDDEDDEFFLSLLFFLATPPTKLL